MTKKPSKKKTAAIKSSSDELGSAKKSTPRVYTLYERSLALLHKNNYRKARESFVKLLKDFPTQIEVAARARCFIRVCDRHLQENRKERLETSEEMFNQAVIQHNKGQYKEALISLSQALKISKKVTDHIHYTMAAVEVHTGNTDQALKHLKKAISLNQENRFFAINDPDFTPLADNMIFLGLVHP